MKVKLKKYQKVNFIKIKAVVNVFFLQNRCQHVCTLFYVKMYIFVTNLIQITQVVSKILRESINRYPCLKTGGGV